ncbi:hypothetical protein B0A55_08890 [Friedmanniomyces simplex]|uniref:Uncharacterized protein n=1 Tax=Friedmanniomyces simplex TaxID=329884 RepID=A0A4U0X9L5_9PEZI|nr:hypothetical protein B0A55_08890 [Friedmanniomyces simplex]
MPRSSTNPSWADRISDDYEDDYTDNAKGGSRMSQSSEDERSRWERECRLADIEDEYQRLRPLRLSGMGSPLESVEEEYERLQSLRPEFDDGSWASTSGNRYSDHGLGHFPSSSGRSRYGRQPPRRPEDWCPIQSSNGPEYFEACRLPTHLDASQRHNRGRPAQSTLPDVDQGIRDVLLAPYTGESKQAYLSRMYRDRESLAAAESRWQDMEGRWRPFVTESKEDHILRIDLCGIIEKPTQSESEARWQVLEGRFEPEFGEGYGDDLRRLSASIPGDERPSSEDCLTRWNALEGER